MPLSSNTSSPDSRGESMDGVSRIAYLRENFGYNDIQIYLALEHNLADEEISEAVEYALSAPALKELAHLSDKRKAVVASLHASGDIPAGLVRSLESGDFSAASDVLRAAGHNRLGCQTEHDIWYWRW